MNPSSINLDDEGSNPPYELLTIPKHAVVQIKNIGAGYNTGDIYLDGIVNIIDIIYVINLILDTEYNSLADLNEDGILNISDVMSIVNIIVD